MGLLSILVFFEIDRVRSALPLLGATRGLYNSLLIFAAACYVLFLTISAIRKQFSGTGSNIGTGAEMPQHRLITALNVMASIGVGVVWTTLIYNGPSLMHLWQGVHGVSHWTGVLLYTGFWLSISQATIPEDRARIRSAVFVRAFWYGLLFFAVIANLNDW
jgi:hypothetical protein